VSKSIGSMVRKKREKNFPAFLRETMEKWRAFERVNAKSEALKAGKFVCVFLAVFLALSFAVSIVPLEFFEIPVAVAIKVFFAGQGIGSRVVAVEPVQVLADNGLEVSVSYLCTGLLEAVVWVAIIAASLGVDRRKRIAGIFFGLAGIAVFNLLRIFFNAAVRAQRGCRHS